MAKWIIAVLAVFLSGCIDTSGGTSPAGVAQVPVTHPDIYRLGTLMTNAEESSPVVWSGRLLAITGIRRLNEPTWLSVDDILTGEHVASVPTPDFTTPSAIVENGVLYVFGNTGFDYVNTKWAKGNQIRMIYTTDLEHWSSPVTVWQAAPDEIMHNTSVTKTPDGFVMTYEFDQPGYVFVSERFLWSADLVTFSPVGSVFSPNRYASAPAIRYVDGFYYHFVTRAIPTGEGRWGHTYIIEVSRSADLMTWERQTSPYAVLSPGPGESISVADPDMIEHGGKVYMLYGYGDQIDMAGESVGVALYEGTMSQFVAEFF